MTRTGVNILLIGLLLAGLGGTLYLLVFFLPIENIQLFERAVLICWGLGAALVLVGAGVGLIGRAAQAK